MTLVWCDAWQWECCGDPFGVGDTVRLTVAAEPDREWLQQALGSALASQVSHAEDHHDLDRPAEGPWEAEVLDGVVRRILKAFGRYGPRRDGDARTLYPVPDSAVMVDVAHLDASPSVADDLRTNGYLVDLDLTQ